MYLVIFTSLLGHYTVQVGGRSVNSSTYYVAAMASFALITACYNNIAVAVTFHFADGMQAGFPGTTFHWYDVLVVAAWGLGGLLFATRYFSWEPRTS
jgi:hypothetical protein